MNLQFGPNILTIIADNAKVTDDTLSKQRALQTARTQPRNAEPTKSDTQMKGEIFWLPAAEPSDHQLVLQIRERDQDAATQLYHRYARRLTSLVTRRCSTALARYAGVEDIVQSVFETFFRRVGDGCYGIEMGDTAWKVLMVIAINRVRSEATYYYAAKRDAHRTFGGEAGRLSLGLKAQVCESPPQQVSLVLGEILERLPTRYRRIVSLRIDGWPVADIARETGSATRTGERALSETRVQLSEFRRTNDVRACSQSRTPQRCTNSA